MPPTTSDHPYPDELGRWVYGLPELFRRDIAGADRAAVPGCYPTSAILPLAPVLAAGLVEPTGIIVDSMSGVSGAGRGVHADLQFGAVDESVKAYKVLTHRHRPEIERALDQVGTGPVEVIFTPHLVPMQRGILTTVYATGVGGNNTRRPASERSRRPIETSRSLPWSKGPPRHAGLSDRTERSSRSHFDERTGTVVLISAIDNLVKGAAGQAVQVANLMLGLDETAGLPMEGWMP